MSMGTEETKDIGRRVRDLERFCASDALSLTKLRSKTKRIPRDAVADSDALNFACENGRVTRGIVDHLLRRCPRSAGEGRGDAEETHERHPLHRACSNPHCPGSAIRLLLDRFPRAAGLCIDHVGTPLHCYLGRKGFKHEGGVVECLVKAYPEALTTRVMFSTSGEASNSHPCTPLHLYCAGGADVSLDIVQLLVDDKRECLSLTGFGTPLTALVDNENISFFPIDIVRYFIENMPCSIVTKNHPLAPGNVLHVACLNEHITVEAMELLLSVEGDMVRETRMGRSLPLHEFCRGSDLDVGTSLGILKLLVKKFPESVRRMNGDMLPIHYACTQKQSFEFCKYLVDMYPESVFVKTQGKSVFHLACAHGSVELVKYLYELYHESLYEQTSDEDYGDYEHDDTGEYFDTATTPLQRGVFALHLASSSLHADRKDVIQFILEKDEQAASRVGKWGRLPLHQACVGNLNLSVVKAIFKACPKAIHTADCFGQFPIHLAMGCDELRENIHGERFDPIPSSKRQTSLVMSYLLEQLPYSLEAKDHDGRVCAHYACSTSHAQLKVKFVEKNCPDSFKTYSSKHGLPIHIACQEGAPVDVIGDLAIMLPGSLNVNHSNLGLPLACAQNPRTFQLLLSLRYHSSIELGGTALHSILLDDKVERKIELISKFVDLSQGEQTVEFQGDFSKVDKKGRYPLHLIFDTFNEDLVNYLKDTYANLVLDVLHCNQGAISVQDSRGWLPLHWAIKQKAPLKVIDLLLTEHSEGAAVKDKQGSLPLHLACRYGSSLAVINLLARAAGDGVALSCDSNGMSPVHVACRNSLPLGSTRCLIDLDETVLTRSDLRGELPIHKACRGGHLMLIQELLSKNAPSASVRNASDELPIHILCKKAGKEKGLLESLTYVETIWKLLLVHPETVAL